MHELAFRAARPRALDTARWARWIARLDDAQRRPAPVVEVVVRAPSARLQAFLQSVNDGGGIHGCGLVEDGEEDAARGEAVAVLLLGFVHVPGHCLCACEARGGDGADELAAAQVLVEALRSCTPAPGRAQLADALAAMACLPAAGERVAVRCWPSAKAALDPCATAPARRGAP